MLSHTRISFYLGLSHPTDPNGPGELEARRGLAFLIIARDFPRSIVSVRSGADAEPSSRIEVEVPESPTLRDRARACAYKIALRLKQDAVAVAFDAVDFELVGLEREVA
jgi:hypothetical protein